MDRRYEVYALADGHFYDTPDRLGTGGPQPEPLFATARRAGPEGWHAARSGDWLTMTPVDPDGAPLPSPAQGWKIHSSATRANAERIAPIVWDYCVPRRIPFKFVPGPHLLHLRNAKYAGRDTSGRFVTVYPADEDRLQKVLHDHSPKTFRAPPCAMPGCAVPSCAWWVRPPRRRGWCCPPC